MHTGKVRTNITIDKELVVNTRKYNVPISRFIDIELRRYFALIEDNSIYENMVRLGRNFGKKYLLYR